MREKSQMLPQSGLISSKKAVWTYLLCVALFSGFALFAAFCDLFVFNQFSIMQAVVSKLDLEATFDFFGRNRDFFPRNQIVVNLLATIFCLGYIKKDTKNYAIGLTPSRDLPFMITTIVLLVLSLGYAVIKIAWKEMQLFTISMFFQMIAIAAFVALGVYLMRKANASRAAKALIPLISLLLMLPFVFGMMLNSFALTKVEMLAYTDVLYNSMLPSAILTAVLAFLPALLFIIGYYRFTNDLLGGVSGAFLTAMMTVSAAMNGATNGVQLEVDRMGPSPVVTWVTNIGWIVALVAFLAAGITFIVLSIVKDYMEVEDACEYEPLTLGSGSIYDSAEDEMRHSTFVYIGAITSVVAVAYAMLSTVWYNSTGIFTAVTNLLEWVIADGKLSKDFNLWVLLPMLPLVLFVVALCLFAFGKKSKTYHAASVLTRWGGLGLLAGDLLVMILMIVYGKDAFVKKMSHLTYVWNSLLYEMENLAIMESVFTIILIASVALLAIYHLCLFFSTEGILHSGRVPKIVHFVAVAGSMVLFVLLIVVAFFAMQAVAMIAATIGAVACLAVALIIRKYGLQARKNKI